MAEPEVIEMMAARIESKRLKVNITATFGCLESLLDCGPLKGRKLLCEVILNERAEATPVID